MAKLPSSLTTVTPFSKLLAGIVFLTFIISAFFAGMKYQGVIDLIKSQQANLVTTKPSPTPDPTASWKTYAITPDSSLGYASYQIKLPADWKQIEHSSNFQSIETFQDTQNIYKLVIKEQKNFNNQTAKPFVNLREVTGLSYDAPITVDEQQGTQFLPRAGSEYIYKALFFSKDTKLVYSITLETPGDGSKINEGKVLFNQILSTFKFTNSGEAASSTPTCRPRPACLDATPRCMTPETSDMCPPTTQTEQSCGGIAATQCSTGYKCQLNGNYPDASGKCIKQ